MSGFGAPARRGLDHERALAGLDYERAVAG
jgi:hypothetical protein